MAAKLTVRSPVNRIRLSTVRAGLAVKRFSVDIVWMLLPPLVPAPVRAELSRFAVAFVIKWFAALLATDAIFRFDLRWRIRFSATVALYGIKRESERICYRCKCLA